MKWVGKRSEHFRDAGRFVGLQPARGNSGESEPHMPSKERDEYLGTLLVPGRTAFWDLWRRQ